MKADDLRSPPHNVEAEQCLLGSLLLDNETFDEVADVVAPGDFFRDEHGRLFEAIRGMMAAGRGVDAITLEHELAARGEFQKLGGEELLRRVLEAPPHSANARYYAQIVRQKAIARGLIAAATAVIRDAYSNQYSADDLLARAEAGMGAVEDGRLSREPRTIAEAGRDSLRRFDTRAAGEVVGARTGLLRLDEMTNGFRPDQLVILGARPSMGKTSLALNICEYAAMVHETPVLFFSLEMGLGELGDRAVCGRAGVDSDDYRKARQRAVTKRAQIARAIEEMEGLPIWIDDTPAVTPSQIASISRRMKRRRGVGLVVVDYLQLVGSEDRRATEFDRVGAAARALKGLSKTVGAPVLALSQLSRKCEERPDKRPLMSDLRSTGQIEQDADVILFLYRHERYHPGQKEGLAEIIVAKQRDGETGSFEVAFDKKRTRFHDIVPNF